MVHTPPSPSALLPLPYLLLLLPFAAACGADDGADDDGVASAARMTVSMAMPARIQAAPPPSSAGSAGSSAMAPPAPPAETRPAAASPTAAAGNAAGAMAPAAPAAPALEFTACTYSEGTYGRNCDSLFVSMKQASPARCVQLTIDNCGENERSLGGRAPEPWSLDSATVGSDLDECELGAFYLDSTPAQRATGTLSWNETTRLPSEIVLDLTLETSSLTAGAASVEVVTTEPIVPSVCER